MSLGIGVIGYGYWGPNILRNISKSNRLHAVMVAEMRPERRVLVEKQGIKTTSDALALIHNPEIQAVAIVTHVESHFELAKQALEAGKHVFITKPFTQTVQQGIELRDLAKEHGLTIMVDHTFLFTSAVKKIRELIQTKALGDILYFDSVRVNLGLVSPNYNVVWDLAPHDLSILLYCLNSKVLEVHAVGATHVQKSSTPQETMAYLSLRLEGNVLAHIHLNWLSPVKIRRTLIAGTQKMLVYDDLEPDEKLKIYDKGIDLSSQGSDILVQYRTGDVLIPKLAQQEALEAELEDFANSIQNHTTPLSDVNLGIEVIRIIEAAQHSMQDGGFVNL